MGRNRLGSLGFATWLLLFSFRIRPASEHTLAAAVHSEQHPRTKAPAPCKFLFVCF